MKRFYRTLPLLSGLALFGAAGGVTLGRSAVSEINPLYFGEAADRFHGDQVPQRPDWSAPQPVQYTQAAPADGLGEGCFGCGRARVEYYTAPALTTYTDTWSADAERTTVLHDTGYSDEPQPDRDREQVIRYANYQVDASEPPAQAESVEAEATPQVELAAAGEPTAL